MAVYILPSVAKVLLGYFAYRTFSTDKVES